MDNLDWPTTVAGEADGVSSMAASACQIGGPIYVKPGESRLEYGTVHFLSKLWYEHFVCQGI